MHFKDFLNNKRNKIIKNNNYIKKDSNKILLGDWHQPNFFIIKNKFYYGFLALGFDNLEASKD